MRSVSVSRAMGERIRRAADASGIPMAGIVKAACADLPTEPAAVAAGCERVWANMPRASQTVRGG
jgi:hypothetical protein